MDLPEFSVMPAGLDDWEPIWKRRDASRRILEPRLLNVVRLHLGSQVDAAATVPVATEAERAVQGRATTSASRRGCSRSGSAAPAATTSGHCPGSATPTPTRSAPTWPASNTQDARAAAGRVHGTARPGAAGGPPCPRAPAGLRQRPPRRVPVRAVGAPRQPARRPKPDLKMRDGTWQGRRHDRLRVLRADAGHERGAGCGRPGQAAALPGPAPAPGCLRPGGCDRSRLIMMGASNLWFASTQSIIVMPRTDPRKAEDLADRSAAWRRTRGRPGEASSSAS